MRDQQGRFKPGTSGNPSGRPPKGESITEILRKVGDEDHTFYGKQNLQLVAEKLFEMAIAGDAAAIKLIFERLDGRVPQMVVTTEIERDELIVI